MRGPALLEASPPLEPLCVRCCSSPSTKATFPPKATVWLPCKREPKRGREGECLCYCCVKYNDSSIFDMSYRECFHSSRLELRLGLKCTLMLSICLCKIPGMHFFCGMLFSGGRRFFLAFSAEGQARGPSVHYDAYLDPSRPSWRCAEPLNWLF